MLAINNIIFKNKCASCVSCAKLNRDAGLRYCILLYFITLFIMVVLGEKNIFCGGTLYKKMRTTALAGWDCGVKRRGACMEAYM
jgi:hypothetical protein